MKSTSTLSDPAELEPRRLALLAALQRCVDANLMRGSLTQLHVRCGREGCVCTRGVGHLKTHLVVRVQGRSHTLYVNEERRPAIEALVASYHRARELIDELTEINLALLRGPRSKRAQPKARTQRPAPAKSKRTPSK